MGTPMLVMLIHSAAPEAPKLNCRALQTITDPTTIKTVTARVKLCCFHRITKVTCTSSQNTAAGSGASCTASTLVPFHTCRAGMRSRFRSNAAVTLPWVKALRHRRCPTSVSKVTNTFEGLNFPLPIVRACCSSWFASPRAFFQSAKGFIPNSFVLVSSCLVLDLWSWLWSDASAGSLILVLKLLPPHVVSMDQPSSPSSTEASPFPIIITISRMTARRCAIALISGPLSLATVTNVTCPNWEKKSAHSCGSESSSCGSSTITE
mmetsp:Transcript_41971/g.82562  ORF Transcript_41971/g.82562 Transcript_41971/m.82562 type:complete len:264 (+) Transcript_41971:242-1033(+)